MAKSQEKFPVLWQNPKKKTCFMAKSQENLQKTRFTGNSIWVIYWNPVLWLQLSSRTLFNGICLHIWTLFYGIWLNSGPCFMAFTYILDPVLWQNQPKRTLFGGASCTRPYGSPFPGISAHFFVVPLYYRYFGSVAVFPRETVDVGLLDYCIYTTTISYNTDI